MAVDEPLPLVGLTASRTGPVRLDRVQVPAECVIAGPATNVMAGATGGSTGGYETTALALGLARAAIDFLATESARRPDLQAAHDALDDELSQLTEDLLSLVRGETVRITVRDDGQRTLLFDLDTAIQRVARDVPDHPATVQLTGVYHNLIRRWADA